MARVFTNDALFRIEIPEEDLTEEQKHIIAVDNWFAIDNTAESQKLRDEIEKSPLDIMKTRLKLTGQERIKIVDKDTIGMVRSMLRNQRNQEGT